MDIETAPNLVHVWGLWQQNVGTNQIIDSGYVLCYAAKWLDEPEVFFDSLQRNDKKSMIGNIHAMLEEADAVVHYNGRKFDIPTLNKEFVLQGLPPPSPYRQIDLLRVARSQFRFPSNKLDYIAASLGLGEKLKHAGHQLWIDCMSNKKAAWKQMEEYNIQDVILLEKLYVRLRPWIKNHPNVGLYGEQGCPTCGSKNINRRGFAYTQTCKYQRYVCKSCKSWFRDKINVGPKIKETFANV